MLGSEAADLPDSREELEVLTIVALEAAQQRTLACGVRPDVKADFAQLMADMRDQGIDPFTGTATALVGPYPASWSRWRGIPCQRAVLYVTYSQPHLEFEVELIPGLICDADWSATRAPHWLPQRYYA